MQKVYFFGKNSDNIPTGIENLSDLFGGKGSNLYKMSKIGIPIPSGLIITTQECRNFYQSNEQMDELLVKEVFAGVKKIESEVGKVFGSAENPLLLSVRSGAKFSMPGMMDTILNLGLNDEMVAKMLQSSENKIFILDCYRRFIQMYSNVVLKIPSYKFEETLSSIKMTMGIKRDSDLNIESLTKFIDIAKTIIHDNCNEKIPNDPREQLINSIKAVFMSWHNERAVFYRNINGISHEIGTAVNIQSMVFGNLNSNSGTGVVFTRNPSNGNKEIYGEYLENAQGEDVVSGIRTPKPIKKNGSMESLEERYPEKFQELSLLLQKIESEYRDMQDIEFTIENGKVWILQTRSGKRSMQAAIKIACEMESEGIISKEEAVSRIDVNQVHKLLHPQVIKSADDKIIASGLPASPGVGMGAVVFTSKDAEDAASRGESVILVREETSPEDVKGMYSSKGILTACGGMTSHAAVVARGMGICCVVGCESITIDERGSIFICQNGLVVKKGDIITLDGNSGEVILGEVRMKDPKISEEFKTIIKWSEEISPVLVRANAETVNDCEVAMKFGMAGIGLCRTEHMFFEKEALLHIRKVIILGDCDDASQSLQKILQIQKGDFLDIFKTIQGLPINIRLLDPPLHEFLPKNKEEVESFSKEAGLDPLVVNAKLERLKEANPMLGNRGSRLGILSPEIYKMQIRAIFAAATECESCQIIPPRLEIMFPFIQSEGEIVLMKKMLESIVSEFSPNEKNGILDFKFGTMIEIPRACIVANKIAKHVDYFSFGTNDLTQTTLGISRDDCKSVISKYKETGLISVDPFVSIDQDGVGELIKIAISGAKSEKPSILLGICGEHGGDVASIQFFCENGFGYVSCSPYRIPIAKLAVAQFYTKKKCLLI